MTKIKDPLTMDMFKSYDPERQLRLLNSRLDYYFQENSDQKRLLIDEKYVINEYGFSEAAERVWNDLEIEDFNNVYPEIDGDEALNWIAEQIAKKKHIKETDPEYSQLLQEAVDLVVSILSSLNLPTGWLDYMAVYIATGGQPTNVKIQRDLPMSVESLDDHSITVRFERNIQSSDYKVAWKALKPYLAQPSPYHPTADNLKNKIYLDRKAGMGVSAIARKYYPHEYEVDSIATIDKVKKTIARFK